MQISICIVSETGSTRVHFEKNTICFLQINLYNLDMIIFLQNKAIVYKNKLLILHSIHYTNFNIPHCKAKITFAKK